MGAEDDPSASLKTLAAPVKSAVDKFQLLPAFLKLATKKERARRRTSERASKQERERDEEVEAIAEIGAEDDFSFGSPSASIKTLAAPVKSAVDKFQLLPTFLKVRGLVKQHIDSFNYFINHDIKKIMKANDRLVCHYDPDLYLRYTNIYVEGPSVDMDFSVEKLTPHLCRLSDRTNVPLREYILNNRPWNTLMERAYAIMEHNTKEAGCLQRPIVRLVGNPKLTSSHQQESMTLEVSLVQVQKAFKRRTL